MAYTALKQLIVWVKTNAGMGSFYRSQHELVLVFKNGTAPHINNFELGQHGRHRSNVWTYPGVNALGPDRLDELQMHPTVKPVALVADAIRDCSKRRGIILDSFVGSGTTIIAAEKTGRRAYAMELDAKYVQTAIRQVKRYGGMTPAARRRLRKAADEEAVPREVSCAPIPSARCQSLQTMSSIQVVTTAAGISTVVACRVGSPSCGRSRQA